MTVETMLKDCSTFFTHSMNELTRKAPDYKGPDGQAFGDLGEIARDMECSIERVALIHASKHWTAIKRYLLGNELKSENIRKRLMDLANYCAMIDVLIESGETKRIVDTFDAGPTGG